MCSHRHTSNAAQPQWAIGLHSLLLAAGVSYLAQSAFFSSENAMAFREEQKAIGVCPLVIKNRDNSVKKYLTQDYFQSYITDCNNHFEYEMVRL